MTDKFILLSCFSEERRPARVHKPFPLVSYSRHIKWRTVEPRLVERGYSHVYELSFIFLKRKGCNMQSTYDCTQHSFSVVIYYSITISHHLHVVGGKIVSHLHDITSFSIFNLLFPLWNHTGRLTWCNIMHCKCTLYSASFPANDGRGHVIDDCRKICKKGAFWTSRATNHHGECNKHNICEINSARFIL